MFQHHGMSDDPPLSLEDLRALEVQVCQQPADTDGTLVFLKDGMLAGLRAAISAMERLERCR